MTCIFLTYPTIGRTVREQGASFAIFALGLAGGCHRPSGEAETAVQSDPDHRAVCARRHDGPDCSACATVASGWTVLSAYNGDVKWLLREKRPIVSVWLRCQRTSCGGRRPNAHWSI